MSTRRWYFRTRPSWSIIAMLAIGLGLLLWGIFVPGSPGHAPRTEGGPLIFPYHAPVHTMHAIDYAKLVAKVAGAALLLAAAVRHGDQLTTIDDLADLTRPEGILSGPRAPGASDAASAAMRLP